MSLMRMMGEVFYCERVGVGINWRMGGLGYTTRTCYDFLNVKMCKMTRAYLRSIYFMKQYQQHMLISVVGPSEMRQ